MLNKKICKRCWNKIAEEGWDEFDERFWKRGYVFCPLDYVEKGETLETKITEQPPSRCPFFLEHIISNQEKILENKKC